MHCAEAIVVHLCFVQVYEDVKNELKLRGGYIMTPEECKKAGATIIKDGRLNAGAHKAPCACMVCSSSSAHPFLG